MSMQYLDAELKDIPEIVELCKSGFSLKDSKLLARLFELYVKRGILIVACTNKIIGYIAARPNMTFFRDAFELSPSLLIPGRLGLIAPWHLRLLFTKGAYLASMVVKPEFRGQGIANSLMQQAINRLGGKQIFVETEGSNDPMYKIVQKLDFKQLNMFSQKLTRKQLWSKS
jgi:ribosomal protein S18 acetylase RimI-like enzyme